MPLFSRRPAARVGDAAPLFSLPDQRGERADLLALRGKRRAVLVFFPAGGGPVTSQCLADLAAARKDFDRLDAVVWGLSPSPEPANARFAEALGLDLRLLADPGGVAGSTYGAWRRVGTGFRRRLVVIDGRGVVRVAWDGVPEPAAVLTFLGGLAGDLR